jgi:D-arabinose 1-dehydrogenase-like Zn-dependent alcohol dehydrogenase
VSFPENLLRVMIQLAMRAMVMERPRKPLVLKEVRQPEPGPGQVRVRVAACAVCRTDLHVLDGELPEPKLPLILGHEIVGRVVWLGPEVTGLEAGQRVGIPWLAWTCGECGFCRDRQENLCERARFTGYTCANSDIPAFPYRDLWHERTLCSVASLTRRDGEEFLQLAPTIPIRTEVQRFPLSDAKEALTRLREGRLQGAAVLVP